MAAGAFALPVISLDKWIRNRFEEGCTRTDISLRISNQGGHYMMPIIKKFQKIIILVLVVLMAVVLLLSTVELAWVIIKDIITPPILLLEIDELLEIFGLFMLVLIGIELLDTIAKTYMDESADHAQIVMAVAIIAIARKVIILDVKDLSGLTLLGIAAIILALCIGYYLIKKKDAPMKDRPQDAL